MLLDIGSKLQPMSPQELPPFVKAEKDKYQGNRQLSGASVN